MDFVVVERQLIMHDGDCQQDQKAYQTHHLPGMPRQGKGKTDIGQRMPLPGQDIHTLYGKQENDNEQDCCQKPDEGCGKRLERQCIQIHR